MVLSLLFPVIPIKTSSDFDWHTVMEVVIRISGYGPMLAMDVIISRACRFDLGFGYNIIDLMCNVVMMYGKIMMSFVCHCACNA